MSIIFFYFLKIIFEINTSKWFENIKNILILKKKFKFFRSTLHSQTGKAGPLLLFPFLPLAIFFVVGISHSCNINKAEEIELLVRTEKKEFGNQVCWVTCVKPPFSHVHSNIYLPCLRDLATVFFFFFLVIFLLHGTDPPDGSHKIEYPTPEDPLNNLLCL